jgi:hypothetical protein
MIVNFEYSLEHDSRNFLRTINGSQNPRPTTIHREFLASGAKPDYGSVRKFLESYAFAHAINYEDAILRTSAEWSLVEQRFLARTKRIFRKAPRAKYTAHLSTGPRCSYSIEESSFFIFYASRSPTRSIMHELFHFFTWDSLHDELRARGLDHDQYIALNESLTVLLNVECADLMVGARDNGYPQHQQLRAALLDLWRSESNLVDSIPSLVSLLDRP